MSSGPGICCRHPAGKRVTPTVVRGLIEGRLSELVVAGVAGDHDMAHAAAAFGGLPGRCADAWLPADPSPARPQMMTERAAFWLILEQRGGHLMIMS
jgi:hypothetical protein